MDEIQNENKWDKLYTIGFGPHSLRITSQLKRTSRRQHLLDWKKKKQRTPLSQVHKHINLELSIGDNKHAKMNEDINGKRF